MNSNDRDRVENHYHVRYLGHYDVPGIEVNDGDGIDVFYQDKPNMELKHSHYMGMYYNWRKSAWFVNNAKAITEASYPAIQLEDGNFLVSRYRHDFKEHGSIIVDGGPAYDRYNPQHPITHRMRVEGDHEVFQPV